MLETDGYNAPLLVWLRYVNLYIISLLIVLS